MIEWFARNHVAANLLMFGIIFIGFITIKNDVAFEVMPDINLGQVSITTLLPGGDPRTIESTITSRIEESIADIEGIKEMTSRSAENFSSVSAEIKPGYNQQNILSDIKVRVDALNTLPSLAEKPVIKLIEVPIHVVGLSVYSDELSYDELFVAATQVRNNLLHEEGITKVSELQAPGREFHIEVTPNTLRKYNLSLEKVGQAIQKNALDISAGNLRTIDGDILVRADGQAYSVEDFGKIPVLNSGDQVLYLRDIAKIVDGYQLLQVDTTYNGIPAVNFVVFRVGKQNTIDVSHAVHQFIEKQKIVMPDTVNIGTYWDTSVVVKDRLDTLTISALQGGFLVIILLSLFLRPAVAMWVSVGIPISFLGAFALMPYLGMSMNMLSMFAFILVLGIVVDDAIVTGENVYRYMREGMPADQAAIVGTQEVAVPVTFGVLTTMVAFTPLLLVEGVMSDFAKQIPLVVLPVLFFSLIESKFILPSHMSHIKPRNENDISRFGQIQQNISRGFENAIVAFYRPLLERSIANKTITMATVLAICALAMGIMVNGWLKVSFFPTFNDDVVFMNLSMPATTGYHVTKDNIDYLVDEANKLKDKYTDPKTGLSYVDYIVSVSGVVQGELGDVSFGTNLGMVVVAFRPSHTLPKSFSILDMGQELRENIGEIVGAEKFSISSSFSDFGSPVSVALYSKKTDELDEVIQQIREKLKSYPNVFDIQDNSTSGKEEIQLTLKPLAKTLGLSLADISTQLRNAVFGFEAQRVQRGHDEMKVMVRYPLSNRSSIVDVQNLPINVRNSEQTIPLSDLVELQSGKSPSAIYHKNQVRTDTVQADIDAKNDNSALIREDLKEFLDERLRYQTDISYDMEGQAKNQKEAANSLLLGLVLVLLVIYGLLAIPFKSFSQPLIVMSVIPISFVGAIIGHLIMGHSLSILSFMGILALSGVVVNDSLVLVDYINKQRERGNDLMQAVLTAGQVRFRPVMLTSLTTFVGLLPLMFSTNVNAQALIPMAISLGFGIVFATMITLIVVPVNYLIFTRIGEIKQNIKRKFA